MKKKSLFFTIGAAITAAITTGVMVAEGDKEPSSTTPAPSGSTTGTAPGGEPRSTVEAQVPAVRPDANPSSHEKPEAIETAIEWLISRQQKNGGWGPGHVPAGVEERTTVGNTCIALQALFRDGHTPTTGTYRREVGAAISYVLGEIEKSDHDSLFVTDIRDSQLQSKLGTYVDTFIAASTLPEFKNTMKTDKETRRLDEGVKKLLAKIEANQAEDGSWKNTGWAPTLAQGFAAKSVNRAAQLGWSVNEEVRERAETFGKKSFDESSGTFVAEGSAGVELYANASSLQQLQDSAITNRRIRDRIEADLTSTASPESRKEAVAKLKRIEATEEELAAAQKAVVTRLEDPTFVAGFGNNGGEEFLSYVSIGESLRDKGGKDWRRWNEKMSANMIRTQSPDGCWKGQHCITGGTFCTSTGLLVLLMDKEMPVADRDS